MIRKIFSFFLVFSTLFLFACGYSDEEMESIASSEYSAGEVDGYLAGYEDGYDIGKASGYTAGSADGYAKGYQAGVDGRGKENASRQAPYIGNINSHVYHLASCSFLPDVDNRIYFTSESSAVYDGYRPCSRCNP